MNKLIQVNIGGIVFQIDEQAYHQLDTYLRSIKKKYAASPDGDEITKDIEARIAELFTEKFKGTNAAVMQADVDEIISIMGKPEDFETETSTEEKANTGNAEQMHRASRFYRDKDNNVLGGVCAGFAARFEIDALWIRLAFLIAFFFAGTGLLLYIILWIIMPEAKTTTEKLEMRGEKVNINNIEKSVKEGAAQFKTRINEFGEEVKQTFSKENVNKSKKNAGDFIESAVETIKPAVKAITKIFSFFVLLICLVIVVALSIQLFTNWGRNFTEIDFIGNHIFEGTTQAWFLVLCAIALIVIPLIGIIISCIKYLLNVKRKTKFISAGLGVLWTLCLLAVIYLGITTGQNFRYEESITKNVTITQPANQVLYIQVDDSAELAVYENFGDGHFQFEGFMKGHHMKKDHGSWHDDDLFNNVNVYIERSADSLYSVTTIRHARGGTENEAQENAGSFTYNLMQMDSILVLPSAVIPAENEKFRAQEIEIRIFVPVGKFIVLDKKLDNGILENSTYTNHIDETQLYVNKLEMTLAGLKPVL